MYYIDSYSILGRKTSLFLVMDSYDGIVPVILKTLGQRFEFFLCIPYKMGGVGNALRGGLMSGMKRI